MNLYTKIVIFMKDEYEPVYPGEIATCLDIHWFIVNKALDAMVKKGMIESLHVPYDSGRCVYKLT